MPRDYEREHREDLQRLQELRPIDDEFMRCIFRGQLGLAQEVLRTITGLSDLVLTREETQHDLKRLAGARSVCLDVYGEDSSGRIYDMEVQRADKGAAPRRARYHASSMDVEYLDQGGSFTALPESYVIFITENDFFGKGAGVYRFDSMETGIGILLDDGQHVLYANAKYKGNDELGDLMHDFLCSDPDDMRNEALADRVRYFKENPEGVGEMSKVMEELREEAMNIGREEGREEGLEKGLEKGLEQGILSSVRNLMETMSLTAQQAMDALRIPADEQPRYMAMI